jgi:hypothetical protein
MLAFDIWSQPSETVTSGGNSGELSVGGQQEFAFDANISSISGASASITFYIDRLALDGNWYSVWNSGAQTATGTVSASLGHGMASNVSLGSQARVRWVLAGTTPSILFSGSLIGK